MSYVVFAEVKLKPACFDAAKQAVRGILLQTLAEPGCETFALHEAADGSSRLMIYERWQDRAAFDFHHAQSYTRAVYQSYENWLAEPVAITELCDIH